MPGTCSQGGLGQGENTGQGCVCVCETRLSVQTEPVTENTASTVGAGNNARKQMASLQLFPTHIRAQNLSTKTRKTHGKGFDSEGGGKMILTTGSDVKRQVLLPAAEM